MLRPIIQPLRLPQIEAAFFSLLRPIIQLFRLPQIEAAFFSLLRPIIQPLRLHQIEIMTLFLAHFQSCWRAEIWHTSQESHIIMFHDVMDVPILKVPGQNHKCP